MGRLRETLRRLSGRKVKPPAPFRVQIHLPSGVMISAIQYGPHHREFAERAIREGRFIGLPPCYLVDPGHAELLQTAPPSREVH